MKMSQIFKAFLMAILLCILPLILSSALRPPYLYFLVNLLVIVLGAEAGLLSFISKTTNHHRHHHHHQEKKTTTFSTHDHVNLAQNPTIPTPMVSSREILAIPTTTLAGNAKIDEAKPSKIGKVVEKPKSPSIKVNVTAFSVLHKGLKKSPTTPSLFFIAGGDDDDLDHEEEDDCPEDRDDHDNGDDNKELFHKAEMFIGNFYKQLKMQREESWNNIHGLAAYMHANPN